MSTLLLDVGNSRVKWALAREGVVTPAQAIAHRGDPAAVVAEIGGTGIHTATIQAITAIRVANVTGAAHAAALAAALEARFGHAPQFVQAQRAHRGLRSAYAEPQRLGVDRWLALLAAWSRVQGAACVVSCGTALTFDAVDAQGQHLGGVIAPGLVTAQQAVLGATRFAAAGPDQAYSAGLGTDTEACVRQGALHACAGLVERLAARQPNAARFITGGDAETLRAQLQGAWVPVPDLVLEGLLAI